MRRFLYAICLLVALLAVLPVGQAHADGEPVITLTAPVRGVLGEVMPLTATLHDASGNPIADATVRYLLNTKLLNKRGNVEIGHAVTDTNGRATLLYEPRESGEIHLLATYETPDGATSVRVALTTAVVGEAQLFTESFGTSFPEFEPWAIVAVLSIVWLTLLSVTLRLHAIASAPDAKDGDTNEVPLHFRKREEWSR